MTHGPATFLFGGGWDPSMAELYGRFLAACERPEPEIACVILDEGEGVDHQRFTNALLAAGACRPRPVIVRLGEAWDGTGLADADGLFVCGGLTPGYQEVIAPAADAVRGWLAQGRPYGGFSAGAALAAHGAVVGGWRLDGRQVCPDEAGEDLDDVTVRPGLGLVPFAVDVHCAQWGTLPRLIGAVHAGLVSDGVAIDENTLVAVRDGVATVHGLGHAWHVAPTGAVTPLRAGRTFELAASVRR
jgi:cyanophycinase